MAQAAAEASKYDGGTASGAFVIGLIAVVVGFFVGFVSDGAKYLFYIVGLMFWGTAAAILTGLL